MPLPEVSLGQLFTVFLRIGCIAFGGLMALISVIEDHVVRQRRWMSQETMLDGVSLANLLPGPIAVNVVAYAGYRIRGGPGALAATVGVILPSWVLITILTYVYFRFGEIEFLKQAFRGFLPAVAGIILAVAWRMAGKAMRQRREVMLIALAFLLILLVPPSLKLYVTVSIVVVWGFVGWRLFRGEFASTNASMVKLPYRLLLVVAVLLGGICVLSLLPLPIAPDGVPRLALTFSGLSVMLFGGGYVFIPMIQEVVVGQYQWVTSEQFVNGIALGQITPGPILISAAFIGQRVAGIPGSLVATAAIFAPPAILMVAASRVLEGLKRSAAIQAALRGVRLGVIGMIFSAVVVILRSALSPWPPGWGEVWPIGLIFGLTLVALLRFQVAIVWIIPAAGLLGLVLF